MTMDGLRPPRLVEIAANSFASARAAEAGGAARVELCTALEVGGLTPSHAEIALARERLRIPVHVLIRPRAGDFVFDDAECEVMLRDIEACRALDCAGVVLGVLDADGNVDAARCRGLVAAARGMSITFHRAFDFARDAAATLESVIELGCDRLLTSGQAPDALAGAARIAGLVQRARDRIGVMPGGGITPENIAQVAQATGACEFHASAKAQVRDRLHDPQRRIGEMQASHWQTDAETVRRCVGALEALASSAPSSARQPSA